MLPVRVSPGVARGRGRGRDAEGEPRESGTGKRFISDWSLLLLDGASTPASSFK
jgi:hypothetical protein